MADALVTQVQRTDGRPTPDSPLTGAKRTGRRGFFSSLLCCVSSRDRALSAPQPQPRQQQQQQQQQQHHAPTMWPAHPDPGTNLLPAIESRDKGRKCLVLDLDETLVHSSFKPVKNADFVVPIEIEGQIHHVYVLKRPHVDTFLHRMGQLFEIVLFTASLAKYADPVSDLLDSHRVFRHRLFREHCVHHRGTYVKDLSRLGREVTQVLIVDNSPASYIFHPQNAVPVESWFDDRNDTELLELIPFFENIAASTSDVVRLLQTHQRSAAVLHKMI